MSKKYQAFIKNFPDLVSSVYPSVKTLADVCRGKELISHDTYCEIMDLNVTNIDKARRLLMNISTTIEKNPSAFDMFTVALSEASCQADSERLSSTLLELEKKCRMAEIETIKAKEAAKKVMVNQSPIGDKNQQELLLTPYASGVEVVDLCIQKLKLWINEENRFMKRIALVMTEFGKQMSTSCSSGGIWQVSPIAFQDTKNYMAHSKLSRKYKRLMDLYQIDWMLVSYADLDKPLYSALAARLYLSNTPFPIPPYQNISEQAAYWKDHYMKGDGGNPSEYLDKVLMLEK